VFVPSKYTSSRIRTFEVGAAFHQTAFHSSAFSWNAYRGGFSSRLYIRGSFIEWMSQFLKMLEVWYSSYTSTKSSFSSNSIIHQKCWNWHIHSMNEPPCIGSMRLSTCPFIKCMFPCLPPSLLGALHCWQLAVMLQSLSNIVTLLAKEGLWLWEAGHIVTAGAEQCCLKLGHLTLSLCWLMKGRGCGKLGEPGGSYRSQACLQARWTGAKVLWGTALEPEGPGQFYLHWQSPCLMGDV
jgi:hypothetical protein